MRRNELPGGYFLLKKERKERSSPAGTIFLFALVVVREADDVRFGRGAEPELHDAGRLVADVADPVGRPAGDDELLVGGREPDAVAERDLEPRVEDDPELGPAFMVLEGQAAARLDGDDLDAAGVLVGEAAELAPGPEVLDDAGLVAGLGRGLIAHGLKGDVVVGAAGAPGAAALFAGREVLFRGAAAGGPSAAAAVDRVEVGRVGRRGRALLALAEEDDVHGLDLRRRLLVPVLVLPAPGPELAFEEDLAALGEVLLAELGQLAEDLDPVPLRPVGGFARRGIEKPLVGGHRERGDPAVLLGKAAHLRLAAEPADEDDLVQAVDVSHFSLSSLILSWAIRLSSSRGYLATRSLRAARASGLRPSSMKLRPFLRWAAAALSPWG